MNRISSHFTKLIVLVAALAVVGGGTAVAAKLITGKQVKNGSLTGKDVKKQSLGVKHLSAKAQTALKGAQGEQGPKGDAGAQGVQGERGPSTAYAIRTEADKTVAEETVVGSIALPDGAYVLQANAVLQNIGKDTDADCRLGVIRGDLFEALDQVTGLDLAALGTFGDTTAISMTGAAKLDNGSNAVELRCAPSVDRSFRASDRTIVATQVAELK